MEADEARKKKAELDVIAETVRKQLEKEKKNKKKGQ